MDRPDAADDTSPSEDAEDRPLVGAYDEDEPSDDPEAPAADALEQAEATEPPTGSQRLPDDPEVPEADALEQGRAVPPDDEY
jgi:hypothetical protein